MKTIREFLDSPLISRSAYIQRYSSSRLTDPENLSMHNYECLMFGLLLMEDLRGSGCYLSGCIDEHEFLLKALFHDAEECLTGDVPRPLKYISSEVHDSLENAASQSAHKLFNKEFPSMSTVLYDIWETSKSGNEGYLVKIADMLTVLRKARYEVELLNNLTFMDTFHNLVEYIQSIKASNPITREDISEHLNNILDRCLEYVNGVLRRYEDD